MSGNTEKVTSRKKILDAAMVVFSQRGFHPAKMDDIAKQAGVAKGTLYYNFSSKSNLFASMVTEGMEMIIGEVRRALESDLHFPDHFRALIDTNISMYLRYSDLSKILFNELSVGMDPDILKEIEKVRERYVAFIADLLREGQDLGYLKPIDTRLVAMSILGLLDYVCNHYIREPTSVSKEQVVESAYTLLASGLLSRPMA